MKVDSLAELRSAFVEWRRRKEHAREAVPDELLLRAQRATEVHGVKAVVQVTRVERGRLFRGQPGKNTPQAAPKGQARAARGSVPAFSRLELGAASAPGPRPLAEVEMASGVKLRVFEETPEMMGLLVEVCGLGGSR